jgi:hypothetical protein
MAETVLVFQGVFDPVDGRSQARLGNNDITLTVTGLVVCITCF